MAVFFRLLYHQFAWSYDLVAAIVSFGKWKDWVRSIVKYLEPVSTLELGFGPGHLQSYLLSRKYPIYGVDLSPQMCQIASHRLKSDGLSKNISCATSTALPFPDNSFRQAIATFPSEYILFPETLTEVRRVLKPGGKLVILAMARLTGRTIPERIMALVYHTTGQTIDLENRTLERILQPFSTLGFKVSIDEMVVQNASLTFLTATLPE